MYLHNISILLQLRADLNWQFIVLTHFTNNRCNNTQLTPLPLTFLQRTKRWPFNNKKKILRPSVNTLPVTSSPFLSLGGKHLKCQVFRFECDLCESARLTFGHRRPIFHNKTHQQWQQLGSGPGVTVTCSRRRDSALRRTDRVSAPGVAAPQIRSYRTLKITRSQNVLHVTLMIWHWYRCVHSASDFLLPKAVLLV